MKPLTKEDMAKKKALDFKFVCDGCGKDQVEDKKQSTKNWKVYPNVPCECGGKFTIKFL